MIELRNGLEEMLKGLEAARVEAIMGDKPHKKIDAAILRYKQKLGISEPSPLSDTPPASVSDTSLPASPPLLGEVVDS